MSSLSRYAIKRKINAGGMATVYLAEDTVLNRDVAIKMIHPHLLKRPEAIQRFNNEAKIIASLSHENIVTVYDYGESDQERYLVMEYIDGLSLVEVLEKYGLLPNLVLLAISLQVLEGLKAAHSKGIFHRDVKPDNVMLDKNGNARIMDFGIAHLVNQESITLTGSFVGSPSYIAPEQVSGKTMTSKSDIFSFGSLLYLCATDRVPFDADNPSAVFHKVINEEPPSPVVHNGALLHMLTDVIQWCLQKDPDLRPDAQQCIDVIHEKCNADGITLDKNRYREFCNDPEKYRYQEKEELYGIYQQKAYEQYRSKKYVAVLKSLDQMRAFGQLKSEDSQLYSRISNRGRIKQGTIIAFIAMTLLAGIFIMYKKMPALNRKSSIVSYTATDTINNDITYQASLTDSNSSHQREELTHAPATAVPEKIETPAERISQMEVPAIPQQKSSEIPVSTQVYGYLNLRTNPPWVTVIIDDIKVGETPKTGIIKLKPGEHRLMLKKTGYRRVDTAISIVEKDTLLKKVMMKLDKTTPQ